jgi:hypothetical protein
MVTNGPFVPFGPASDDDPQDPEDTPSERASHTPRGLLGRAAAGLCCTGQLSCGDEFVGPWSGQPRQAWCSSCTDGCGCCDCCSDCDGCCDCDCC